MKDTRLAHIEFIENDTKQRGEIITSDITFFAAIYSLKVKKKEDKKSKTIVYSAAKKCSDSYRPIQC